MTQEMNLGMAERKTIPARATRRSRRRRAARGAVYYAVKRAVDIVIAAAALTITAPVLLASAIAIGLDSRGPVIFKQTRVGAKRAGTEWTKKNFTCYKFRTMFDKADSKVHEEFVRALIENDQAGMEQQNGASEARKLLCDKRITRVGRFLRKTSIDELPQFWNVLRGEMSVVGPRPPIPYEVEMYKPWHEGRLNAKPGITGLWQVTARSSADFDEMVRLDLEYIQRRSLWLDLWIIVKTPLAVFSGKGAV